MLGPVDPHECDVLGVQLTCLQVSRHGEVDEERTNSVPRHEGIFHSFVVI